MKRQPPTPVRLELIIILTESPFDLPGKLNVNLWEEPAPPGGLTLIPVELPLGTVHEPIFCQLPCCWPPEYHEAQIVLEPANAGVNVTVADSVTLLAVTATLVPAMLHWLLESAPLPGVSLPAMAVPESSTRSTVFGGGS